MWQLLAKFIIKNRLPLVILLGLSTIVMAFFAKDARLDYNFAKIIPKDNPIYQEYLQFRKQFGDDDNRLMIGWQSKDMFQQNVLNDGFEMGNTIKKVDGVEGVLSLMHAFKIGKDTTKKSFVIQPAMDAIATSQQAADSIKAQLHGLPFYEGLLYNKKNDVYLMAVSINPEWLDSKRRVEVVNNILKNTNNFGQRHNIEMHYSGLPYLRTFRTTELVGELRMFLALSVIMAFVILLLLFRAPYILLFPASIVTVGLLWFLGLVVLFGFKMTILTALIPPLIVVISVPNCVYMINRYHAEMRAHGDKEKALAITVERIGLVVFFANLTTAIGFSVFAFMRSSLLHEFGLVSGLSIAMLFVASIILVPAILSWLPAPKEKHMAHLDVSMFKGVVGFFKNIVTNHSKVVQGLAALLLFVAIFGVIQLQVRGYIFDDVSEGSQEYKDLKFFEKHLNGVLPFDILVDTKKKKGATQNKTLRRLNEVQDIFAKDPLFSRAISIAEGLKFINQGFYGGKAKYYDLPSSRDKAFIYKYLKNMEGKGGSNDLLNAFTDSTQQVARISVQMADVGSDRFGIVLDSVRNRVSTVLDTTKYDITYTGTSLVAIEGYNYLVKGLVSSVLFAFLLIALVIGLLFKRIKMLLIALIPNAIPLMVTAAIMGYFNIFLKPATVLIFSIAFGISVDFTIHFLAKYRQELQYHGGNAYDAVMAAIDETGLSMVYTAIILFFGFFIFTASNFQGTFYMGLLTSITIIVALFANLILLPVILVYWVGDVELEEATTTNN